MLYMTFLWRNLVCPIVSNLPLNLRVALQEPALGLSLLVPHIFLDCRQLVAVQCGLACVSSELCRWPSPKSGRVLGEHPSHGWIDAIHRVTYNVGGQPSAALGAHRGPRNCPFHVPCPRRLPKSPFRVGWGEGRGSGARRRGLPRISFTETKQKVERLIKCSSATAEQPSNIGMACSLFLTDMNVLLLHIQHKTFSKLSH